MRHNSPSRLAILSLPAFGLLLAGSSTVRAAEPAHFHHVHLNVTDPAATADYYSRFHGALPIRYRDLSDALFTETAFILLDEVPDPPPSALETGIWHIGWGGRDVPSEYEWFKERGATIRVPLYPLGNIHVFYLSGPDDEMIEVNTMGHNRFAHIHLLAKDVNETVQWYKRHLGAEVRRDYVKKPDDMQSVRAWSNGFQIDHMSFIVYGIPDYTPSPPWWQDPPLTDLKSTDGRVIDHLAFSYRDLQPEYDRLKAAGVPIVSPIRHRPEYGHNSFFVRGPDKVLIEIVEAKPIPEGVWE